MFMLYIIGIIIFGFAFAFAFGLPGEGNKDIQATIFMYVSALLAVFCFYKAFGYKFKKPNKK